MKNFIDVLGDKSNEEKLEVFYNKNRKYIIPIIAAVFVAVYSFDLYNKTAGENLVGQSNIVGELKNKFVVDKFNNLTGSTRILLIDDIVKSNISAIDKKDLLLKITDDNSEMRPMVIEYVAESLIVLDFPNEANDLLSQNSASLSPISLLMKANVYEDSNSLDEALVVYNQAHELTKTPELQNLIKLKIKSISIQALGVKK